MRNLDGFALENIRTITDLLEKRKHSSDIKILVASLVGIIYALLYIGDCIKELKSEN